MQLKAASTFTLETDTKRAAMLAARSIAESFGDDPLKLVLVYGTINHEQSALLDEIRNVLGQSPRLVGCSAQGVVTNCQLTEEGYGLGVMGLGGRELVVATARQPDILHDTREKGRALAAELSRQLAGKPQLIGVLYDASRGPNVQEMLAGIHSVLPCPIIGGGASLSWGLPVSTYQYYETEAMQHGAVAFGLAGPFDVQIGLCHCTSPTGVMMTVTRAQGNQILQLDGRSAAEVFSEATGHVRGELLRQDHLTSWAIALERATKRLGPNGPEQYSAHLIRAAVGIDYETGAVRTQAAIPEGTRVSFHHRTTEATLNGTKAMGDDLARRLQGKKPWAILGFECRARTVPFLGPELTMAEHTDLCARLGTDIPWLGMMAWGELAPVGGEPEFHNYTYPLTALVPSRPT